MRALLCTVLLAVTASSAQAQGLASYDEVAVQKRKYQLANELRLSVGTLPIDPYRKGFAGSLSFTRHFNQFLAWEIFHASFSLLTRTDLSEELINVFGANPESNRFAAPRMVLTTGIELTPLYGKWALLNDGQIHHAFIVGGYGGVIFGNRVEERSRAITGFDVSRTLSDVRPSFGPGIGYRVYLNNSFSLRVDTRLLFSIRPDYGLDPTITADPDTGEVPSQFGVDSVLLINLGLAWNFGADV
ncbi:MAG: hypothetical protein AAF627_05660 [Myxococcota bacterium]